MEPIPQGWISPRSLIKQRYLIYGASLSNRSGKLNGHVSTSSFSVLVETHHLLARVSCRRNHPTRFRFKRVRPHPRPFVAFVLLLYYSRMRGKGFSFNSGGLGVEPCSRPVVSAFATARNRSQPSASDRSRALRPLPLGEAFGEGLGWHRDVSDSCEIAWKRVEMYDLEV